MSNSPLAKYAKLSPNHSGQRQHEIDTITPHCVVGHLSLETLGNVFFLLRTCQLSHCHQFHNWS